jgi:hypothetical protein
LLIVWRTWRLPQAVVVHELAEVFRPAADEVFVGAGEGYD